MYCPYCGTKCEDIHRFCFHCGQALPVIAEEEQTLEIPNALPETTAPAPEAPAEELMPVEETAPAEALVPAEETTSTEEPAEAIPAPRKGRLWPPIAALVSMICVGLLVFFLFPFNTASTSETPWFTIEDGKLYFDASVYTGSDELVIPETVDGETVTYIAENAFYNCDFITTVILPDTLTRIGEYAFSDCDNLRGIFIPESVTRISNHAFYDCDALEAIYLSNTLNHLSEDALGQCASLKYIIFDGSYSEWTDLYNGGFITEVELHTSDGTYRSQP